MMVVGHSCFCLLPLKSVMATDVLTTSSAAPPDEGSVVNPRPVSLEHTDSVVLPAWPTKCDYVVKEILKTERDYVNSLEDILKVELPWKPVKGSLYIKLPNTPNTCLLYTSDAADE